MHVMIPQVERRGQQRFALHFPLSMLRPAEVVECSCVTRDVSTGGIYFYADSWDDAVTRFDFCAVVPVELTLGQPVNARCSAVVLRVDREGLSKPGVAAKVEGWTLL